MTKLFIRNNGVDTPVSLEDFRWFFRGWWYVFPLLFLDIYLGLGTVLGW